MSMKFGYAQADITPASPTPLSGYASREGLARGTLRPLTARALAIASPTQRIVLLALDLIGPPDEMPAELKRLLPHDITVIVAATHTHSGPPVLARAMLGEADAQFVRHITVTCAGIIKDAFKDATELRLAHRKVLAEGIAFNRRDRMGPVDHYADAVTFHDAAGRLVMAWVNFACHPVVLGPENDHYSPDFPGEARACLENALAAKVIYTTGTSGQINLGHSALDSIRKIGMDRRTPAEAVRIGTRLADAILADFAAEAPKPISVDHLAYAEQSWPARFSPVDEEARRQLAKNAAAVLGDATATIGEKIMARIDCAWLASRPAGLDLTVSALAIGPLTAVFMSGEIFVETGLAVQAAFPGAIAVGYAHSNPGYIPHRTAEGRGGYEVDIAWRPYGAPGPFAPGTGDEVESCAIALARKVQKI